MMLVANVTAETCGVIVRYKNGDMKLSALPKIFFFRTHYYNKLEGTMTGFQSPGSCRGNIPPELGRLTGSWKILQNEEFTELYR